MMIYNMEGTVLDKEVKLLQTLIECNELLDDENSDIYGFNFQQLYEHIGYSTNSAVKISNGNKYKYFTDVYKFLDSHELSVYKTLNESLKPSASMKDNTSVFDIDSFKTKLYNHIKFLETQDDTNLYSHKHLKIKTYFRKPLIVRGFDICDYEPLLGTVGLSRDSLTAVAFNKNTREIYFVTDNLMNSVSYSIDTDEFNKIANNSIRVSPRDYLSILKEFTGINNIIELYLNTSKLDLKYTDNLYKDEAFQQYRQKVTSIVR